MAQYPLAYVVFSNKLQRPTAMILVTQKGKWASYQTESKSPQWAGHNQPDNYYDEPKRALQAIPVSTRNNVLDEEVVLREGLVPDEISDLITDVEQPLPKSSSDKE